MSYLRPTYQHPSRFFRAGAMVILRHPKTFLVLAGKRTRTPESTWQFPQGGIETNQLPLEAAFAELKQETGITSDKLGGDGLFGFDSRVFTCVFDQPTEKHGWGQSHFVFYGSYDGPAEMIGDTDGEFSELAWMSFDDVIDQTAPFRRQQYHEIQQAFDEMLFRLD